MDIHRLLLRHPNMFLHRRLTFHRRMSRRRRILRDRMLARTAFAPTAATNFRPMPSSVPGADTPLSPGDSAESLFAPCHDSGCYTLVWYWQMPEPCLLSDEAARCVCSF